MISKPVREARTPKPLKRSGRKGKRTSKRRRSRLSMRLECDRRFAIAVKARDGWACRACGDHLHGVQCAHLLSRRYHAVRWVMSNAVALCPGCHVRFTHDPLAWDDWITDRFGDGVYGQLKMLARQGVDHIDYEAILATLP